MTSVGTFYDIYTIRITLVLRAGSDARPRGLRQFDRHLGQALVDLAGGAQVGFELLSVSCAAVP